MAEESARQGEPPIHLPRMDELETEQDLLVEHTTLDGHAAPTGPWWRQRRWLTVLVGVALAALLASTAYAAVRYSQPHPMTARVTQGNLTLSVAASGPLQSAVYYADFAASGKVTDVAVKVGATVTTGDTLATLDATPFQDAVNQAQAALTAAQTALTAAQQEQSSITQQTAAQSNAAYSTQQAALASCAPNNTTCQQQARDAFAAAQARIASERAVAQSKVDLAQAQVDAAQAQLQSAQNAAQGATLTAPHSGIIAAVHITPGSAAGRGGQPAFEIVDLSSLQVVAQVPEAQIARVKVGNAVSFQVRSVGAAVFRGTVSALAPVGTAGAAGATYAVFVDVDAPSLNGHRLLPGMQATTTIVTTQLMGVLLVPESALRFGRSATDPKRDNLIPPKQSANALAKARDQLLTLQNTGALRPDANAAPAVVIQQTGGHYVATPVVVGVSDGTRTEVLWGLTKGEVVATGIENNPLPVLFPR